MTPGARPASTPGLINAAQRPAPPLAAIQQGIEAKVQLAPPAIQQNYQAIVVSGMKLLYSPQTVQHALAYLDKITGPADVPRIVAHGVLQMLALISKESRGKLSMPAAALAVVTLMAQALETVQLKLKITITPDVIAQTHQLMMTGLFKLFKISRAQVQNAVSQGQAAQRGRPQGAPSAPGVPPQGTPAAPVAPQSGGA